MIFIKFNIEFWIKISNNELLIKFNFTIILLFFIKFFIDSFF